MGKTSPELAVTMRGKAGSRINDGQDSSEELSDGGVEVCWGERFAVLDLIRLD